MILKIGEDKIVYSEDTQSIIENTSKGKSKEYKIKTFVYPFKRIKKFVICECWCQIDFHEDYIGEFKVSMLTGQVDEDSICLRENIKIKEE